MRYRSDETRQLTWFSTEVEILTTSEDVKQYPPLAEYIDIVKKGQTPVSEDIHKLIHIIENHLYPMLDNGTVYMDLSTCEDMRLVPQKAFPFGLFPWETFLIPIICGFRFSEDDILVFNEYFLYMARGAGKNGFMSWIIYGLISKINGIPHYDVAVSASSERQSKTSFTDIFNVLATVDPDKKSFKRTKTEIISKSTNSMFQYLSSNAKTADGLRLGAMYLDEIHAIEDYGMMKVLRSSLGKIPDARMLITTTDGYIRGAVLDGYKDKGQSILDEEKGFWFPRDDNRFTALFPFMHHIDTLDEATTVDGWYKANPSLAYNKNLMQIYRQECIDMTSDAELNLEFHAKRVNYPKEDNRFSLATHEQITHINEGESLEEYADRLGLTEVIGVLDYSETIDLTSCGIIMQDTYNREYYYQHKSFITLSSYQSGQIKPQVLRNGEEDKNLEIVYKQRIEPMEIVNYFLKMSEKYFIRTIYIDQYKSTIIKPELERWGFTVVTIATNMKTHTQILPVLDELFIDHKVHAPNDRLFMWSVGNVYKKVGSHGITFEKIEPKSRKTDPVSAFICGLIGEYCYNNVEITDLNFAGKVIE